MNNKSKSDHQQIYDLSLQVGTNAYFINKNG